jgi:hypothetical protein
MIPYFSAVLIAEVGVEAVRSHVAIIFMRPVNRTLDLIKLLSLSGVAGGYMHNFTAC